MSAGKGDRLRKGADLKKYRDNYSAIFGKEKKENERSKKGHSPRCCIPTSQ